MFELKKRKRTFTALKEKKPKTLQHQEEFVTQSLRTSRDLKPISLKHLLNLLMFWRNANRCIRRTSRIHQFLDSLASTENDANDTKTQ